MALRGALILGLVQFTQDACEVGVALVSGDVWGRRLKVCGLKGKGLGGREAFHLGR